MTLAMTKFQLHGWPCIDFSAKKLDEMELHEELHAYPCGQTGGTMDELDVCDNDEDRYCQPIASKPSRVSTLY